MKVSQVAVFNIALFAAFSACTFLGLKYGTTTLNPVSESMAYQALFQNKNEGDK
ncbi:hypothetical protein ACG9WR_01325 [Acinetobacter pittii]|uniref:hypothetical protein n=1 Tax=Acinetobacter pittii TaxID=48296 RepID=UPI003AF56150